MLGAGDPHPRDVDSEEARFQFSLPATIAAGELIAPATLVNLSRSGVRLRTDEQLGEGVSILVDVPQWPSLKATTVWCDAGYLGAQLDAQLQLETLSLMIKQAAGFDRMDGMIYI